MNRFEEFSNESDFRKFIYDNICQCYNQCINADLKMVPKQSICTEILINENDSDNICYYDFLLENAIKFFETSNIIIKSGIKYYIINKNIKTKLTWENIKSLKSNELKELFWLFRKLIIDTILRQLLIHLDISSDTFKIYSVGSTSLSSDYDITLYGSNDEKIKVITEFQKRFKEIFGDDSSVVFDTNIYGKAFISFITDSDENLYYKSISCNNQNFYYLQPSSENSQLMWGLVKYLRDIRDAFSEHIYNDLLSFMIKKIPSLIHLHHANKTLIYLRNKDSEKINYTSLFDIEDDFISSYDDKLLGLNDYISLTNFYGVDTYFTRGAFIDTVVNIQMCKQDTIKLSSVDYISSILENAGFFFIHNNKTKYFIRVYKTILKLVSNYSEYSNLINTLHFMRFKNIIEGLKITQNNRDDYDERYCKWIGNDDFDLLYCEKFTLFNILFKLIYHLLALYSSHNSNIINDEISFPFYFNYVIKFTADFGSPIHLTPSTPTQFEKMLECKDVQTLKKTTSLLSFVEQKQQKSSDILNFKSKDSLQSKDSLNSSKDNLKNTFIKSREFLNPNERSTKLKPYTIKQKILPEISISTDNLKSRIKQKILPEISISMDNLKPRKTLK